MNIEYSKVTSILAGFFLALSGCTDEPEGISASSGHSGNGGIFGLYEQVSAALVADDLDAVLDAARKVSESGEEQDLERAAGFAAEVAASEDLEKAREAFIPLSREVVMLAAGKEGYYVMDCPMVENGTWLQSAEEVKNPYMGQRMVACGGVVMETADIELGACCVERRACCDDPGGCCPV